MYRIQTLNKISPIGLDVFPRDRFEIASEIAQPDAMIVRSFSLHGVPLPDSLKAIARAGAGYNNIPVDECSKRGIVVFNTPGANANAVKELVVAGLLLSSRKIYQGMSWVSTLKANGDGVAKLVEDKKGEYTGPEIAGKKLGVIGLGAIGVMVANAAAALGMEVVGYDPYISVESAWNLSKDVRRAISLDSLLVESDYVTLHIPMDDSSRGLISREKIALMKKGVRILNFARGGLVNNQDLLQGIRGGKVAAYVTDFPEEDLVSVPEVLAIPHLGASTPESEDNCAKMASKQIKGFLECGTIKNSVNFPDCMLEPTGEHRIAVSNFNVPNMVGQITSILAEAGINIADMINRHRGDLAYNIIDTEQPASDEIIRMLSGIEGVLMVRGVR